MAINPPVDATQTPEWAALQKHYDELQAEGVSLKKWFAEDDERVDKLSFDAGDLHFDLSKNLIKPETLQLFANLAKAVKLDERTKAIKEIIEPLRDLFKDEVRKAGLELGIPEYLVFRQPFPGPGLGIRIIGEVTAEKVKMVQEADAIWREEIAKAGIDREIGQYFAALTNMRSVGVMGDERTYDYAIALRAVTTTDFMTAESAEIPWEVIGKTTSRIVNEVKHINRVMYDCTGKPPATIEFE